MTTTNNISTKPLYCLRSDIKGSQRVLATLATIEENDPVDPIDQAEFDACRASHKARIAAAQAEIARREKRAQIKDLIRRAEALRGEVFHLRARDPRSDADESLKHAQAHLCDFEGALRRAANDCA